jgi:hypothetical protein
MSCAYALALPTASYVIQLVREQRECRNVSACAIVPTRRRGLEHFRFLCSKMIAAMSDVICAFVGHEEPQGRGHQLADVLEGARTRGAEERFQFREGQFDRIEVGTVRRQKSEARADLLNRDTHLGLFVGSEVVEDNDIPRFQRGHQDLLDVGAEGDGVDRSVEHGRRGQLRGAERGDHRVCLPMAAGRVIPNARPARASGVAA